MRAEAIRTVTSASVYSAMRIMSSGFSTFIFLSCARASGYRACIHARERVYVKIQFSGVMLSGSSPVDGNVLSGSRISQRAAPHLVSGRRITGDDEYPINQRARRRILIGILLASHHPSVARLRVRARFSDAESPSLSAG